MRAAEKAKRDARREERRRKRQEEREREELGRMGVTEGKRGDVEVEEAVKAQLSMEEMMGFGGFGGTKRK